jgi:branched-chain amino acid transport system permease protein
MRVLFLVAAAVPALAQMPTCSAPMWSPCDLVFALQEGEDPARATLRGDFRSPHRDTKTIRAFREGNTLVLRFTPDEVGEWDYRLTSSLRRLDAQLGKAEGAASEAPGFVRTANVHHFQTANLAPHLWMSSAIENFAAMPRADFDAAVAARVAEKFTHLRVTIGADTDLREAAERIRVIHDRGLVTDLGFASIPEDRRTGENHLAQVLLTVGIAFVIGDVALQIWGGDNLMVPAPAFLKGAVVLPGDIYYPKYRFVLIFLGVAVGALLWLLYKKTQLGAVVRAGVDDREQVNATGINVDRLFVMVSALASFLAGLAGVAGGAFLTLYPGAEWEILVYALVVVIVGGLGSLEGAMIGALIVGLLDAYGRWLLPEFSYFVLFGPIALLMLFRPRGLFGREY